MSATSSAVAVFVAAGPRLAGLGVAALCRTTLVLGVTLAAGWMLRLRAAAVRAAVYRAGIAGAAACLLLTGLGIGRLNSAVRVVLPGASITGEEPATTQAPLPAPGARVRLADPIDSRTNGVAHGQASVRVLPASTPIPAIPRVAERRNWLSYLSPEHSSDARQTWYASAAAAWLAGAIAVVAWLAACATGAAHVRRRCTRVMRSELLHCLQSVCAEQGVAAPELLEGTRVPSVFLVGLVRPAILVPAGFDRDFDEAAQRGILAHEVAHMRNRDGWWSLAARLLCAALWTQPLAWALRRAYEAATEEACDDAALATGGSPQGYAAALVALAQRMSGHGPMPVAGLGVVSGASTLERRIRRALAFRRAGRLTPSVWLSALLVALCLAGSFGATLSVAAVAPHDNSLDKDKRLDVRVQITAEGVALNELLPLVAAKTGVAIEADRLVGDDKVVILGPARPLRDVLADVAELFNDGWAVSDDARSGQARYVLTRDLRARRYEERLAEAGDQALLAQMDAQVRALGESPEALARRPENDPIRKALTIEEGRTATGIFALLTLAQKEQLIQNWQVKLPVSTLSEQQKDAIAPMFFGDRFAPEKNQGFHLDQIPRDQMDKHDLTFMILNGGGAYRQSGFTAVFMSAPVGFNMSVGEFPADAKFPLPAHGNPYTGRKVSATAALPNARLVTDAEAQQAWMDRLLAIAGSGAPIVADYYRSRPVMVAPEGEAPADPNAPIGALDTLCRPLGYMWWPRGRSLLLRKRDWYNQRLYEVPDRWLTALSRQIRAHNGKPTYADAFALLDLTTDQMIGMMESLDRPADRRLLAGLREAFECAAAAPGDKTRPFFDGILRDHDTLRAASIMPDFADPRQRALFNAFAAASEKVPPLADGEIRETGIMFDSHHQGGITETTPSVPLDINIFIGPDGMRAGYLLALPTRVPDDRRDKTAVQVAGS